MSPLRGLGNWVCDSCGAAGKMAVRATKDSPTAECQVCDYAVALEKCPTGAEARRIADALEAGGTDPV